MSHMSAAVAYSGFPGTLLFPDVETYELAQEDSLEQGRTFRVTLPESGRSPSPDPRATQSGD